MKVLHIITSLEAGGAQAMLYKIVANMSQREFRQEVIVLSNDGMYGSRFRDLGVEVRSLGMKAARPRFRSISRVQKIVRAFEPDIIQGWMYHGNIVAELASSLSKSRVLTVWNIRHSLSSLIKEKPMTRIMIKMGAILTARPSHIVYNSEKSAAQHEKIGYDDSKRTILVNGFDLGAFYFSSRTRQRIRQELRVNDENFLVGMIARFHPMKNHKLFIDAATQLCIADEKIKFLLAGSGTGSTSNELVEMIDRAGLRDRFYLMGEQDDIAGIMCALDTLVLPSAWGEGFPNVIGEAMACERMCIATDIGDTAKVIGEFGIVVPPNNLDALTSAIKKVRDMPEGAREDLGAGARGYVEENFSLPKIVEQYCMLYRSMSHTYVASPSQ